MATWSKACTCGHSPAGMMGSKPAKDMGGLSCECSVLSGRSLHQTDHLSRGGPSPQGAVEPWMGRGGGN